MESRDDFTGLPLADHVATSATDARVLPTFEGERTERSRRSEDVGNQFALVLNGKDVTTVRIDRALAEAVTRFASDQQRRVGVEDHRTQKSVIACGEQETLHRKCGPQNGTSPNSVHRRLTL